jgi:hypothetical protein
MQRATRAVKPGGKCAVYDCTESTDVKGKICGRKSRAAPVLPRERGNHHKPNKGGAHPISPLSAAGGARPQEGGTLHQPHLSLVEDFKGG